MASILADIKGFLDANSYHKRSTPAVDPTEGLYPFVTISRQYGAGGRGLARVLLRHLNSKQDAVFHDWKVFDREMCEAMLDEPSLRNSVEALLAEEYHSEVEAIVLSLLGGARSQPAAYSKLFETIRSLATIGKVIIVGRAGSCATKSLPLGVHLRLVASEESRISRMKLRGKSLGEARRELERRDDDRARLVRNFFHESIDDPLLYDAVFNTGRTSLDSIAAMVLNLVSSRLAESEGQDEQSLP